jgi:hypothetical protein
MPGIFARSTLFALTFVAAASAAAQTHHRRAPSEDELPPPPLAGDRRDTAVPAGAFSGRPYWLALAQCGGIYFKLNVLYTDAAVQARVVKPDPKAAADDTKKLNESIRTATTYFDAAEHFLMSDRTIERADAVLTYDGQSRASGDRLKTVDAAIAAAKPCLLLYRACQEAHPKQCNESLAPVR